MQESINIWGINEYDGDGVSCSIVPANIPFHKKMLLTFFRFGVCPMCVTMSIAYKLAQMFKQKKERANH